MPVDSNKVKEFVRPQIVAFLHGLEGQILLDDEPASPADIAVMVNHLFQEGFEAQYAEVVRKTGMDNEELRRILPGVIAEICEEERARGTQ